MGRLLMVRFAFYKGIYPTWLPGFTSLNVVVTVSDPS